MKTWAGAILAGWFVALGCVPPPAPKPPVANAGPDQSVLVNASVQLDGSASTDPDGHLPLLLSTLLCLEEDVPDPAACPAVAADHHIFEDGHSCRDLRELECPPNSFAIGHERFESCDFLPFEDHLSGIWLMKADDAVEKGGLTSAVRTDQTADFTLIDLEGDMVIGHHPSKVFNQIVYFKKCHAMHLFFGTAR